MKEPTINFRQYQSPKPDGGKMIKLLLLVTILLLVGWLVKRGLQQQASNIVQDEETKKENVTEIRNVKIDTLNK